MITCPRCQTPVRDESRFCDHCGNPLLSEAKARRWNARTFHTLIRVVALTAFVFGLLVWAYVIVIQVTHPDWIPGDFSHIEVFPFNWRLDNVGMSAFAVAVVGFLVWQIELNMKDNSSQVKIS